MVSDIRNRLPPGTSVQRIIATLGPSEARFDDLCAETQAADACLMYHVGALGVDPVLLIVATQHGQVVEMRTREL